VAKFRPDLWVKRAAELARRLPDLVLAMPLARRRASPPLPLSRSFHRPAYQRPYTTAGDHTEQVDDTHEKR
jgi:hypothetical protein